jgi:hypothetical protein
LSPSNHPTTPLASAQVNHDELKVELIEPDTMPAMVRIVWPEKSSMIDPKRFGDTAAALVRIFSEAHVTLARIKARRSL